MSKTRYVEPAKLAEVLTRCAAGTATIYITTCTRCTVINAKALTFCKIKVAKNGDDFRFYNGRVWVHVTAPSLSFVE